MVEPQVEQAVEIDRLVGAMKIADAEMHDTGRKVAPCIGRDGRRRADPGQVFD
jgi:hypothetical protein